MSDEQHPLGEEAENALAEAFYEYREKLEKIFKPLSDEQLMKFAGQNTGEKVSDSLANIEQHSARMEVIYRETFRRAEKVMDETGATVYCVVHDSDARECSDKHDD